MIIGQVERISVRVGEPLRRRTDAVLRAAHRISEIVLRMSRITPSTLDIRRSSDDPPTDGESPDRTLSEQGPPR